MNFDVDKQNSSRGYLVIFNYVKGGQGKLSLLVKCKKYYFNLELIMLFSGRSVFFDSIESMNNVVNKKA